MKQAMILAAGLGTRLKPLTDTMPKALVPVGGKPLLEWNIRKLQAQGYDRFVINIHHFAQQIRDYVAQQDYAPLVHFSDETSQLLETGGGLKHAQDLFSDEEPILIHNVDILDNVDYGWFARQHQADEDAVLLVSKRQTKRYLLFDNGMRLMGWKNIETGEIMRDPVDELWHPYPKHPVSGVELKGRIVPYWGKVKETVLAAADKVPDIYYISWDVAVSEDGNIYLIEGNSCGDGMWLKDGGEWPVYESAIRDNRLMIKYKLTYNYIIKFHLRELMSYLKSYDEEEA